MNPVYIGDGIYLQQDQEDPTRLILTTNSHLLEDADAVVYLEIEELQSLMQYIGAFLQKEGF